MGTTSGDVLTPKRTDCSDLPPPNKADLGGLQVPVKKETQPFIGNRTDPGS